MKLGKMIREIREDHGHDQTQFAKIMECSQSYVSKIEKGWATPNAYFIQNLLFCFRADLNELFKNGELP